jgi:hypothetical protein
MNLNSFLILICTFEATILNATPLFKVFSGQDATTFEQYSYLLARHKIKSSENNYHITEKKKFNDRETVVGIYFEKLKNVEFQETWRKFIPSKPIEKQLEAMKRRKIYELLKKVPKGGNLHLHEDQVLIEE